MRITKEQNQLAKVNGIISRYQDIKKHSNNLVTVYHGRKYWNQQTRIISPAIEYMIKRGQKEKQAFAYAEGLLERLTDFSNLSILNEVMTNAQYSGYANPFVSTTLSRNIARSFALQDGKPGFILTIQAPENCFFDFNGFRSHFGLPQPSAFEWLEEYGIPFMVTPPFKLLQVDRIEMVKEDVKCIFTACENK